MNLAFQIAFKKGPTGDDRPAKLGLGNRATTFARNDGGFKMARRAIAVAGTKSAPPMGTVTNFVQASEHQEFSAVILDLRRSENLSRKQIGNAAGVGPETVKAWERGRQKGQWDNIARLARKFHSVRSWALRDLGLDEWPEFMTPRLMNAIMAGAYQVMHQPGPDGDALREELAQGRSPYKGMNKP